MNIAGEKGSKYHLGGGAGHGFRNMKALRPPSRADDTVGFDCQFHLGSE